MISAYMQRQPIHQMASMSFGVIFSEFMAPVAIQMVISSGDGYLRLAAS